MITGEGALRGVLHGAGEAVFRALPQTILHGLRSPKSESSLLWNLIYPRAQPVLPLESLLALKPLWGSAAVSGGSGDRLTPYYWGFDVGGRVLPGLRRALDLIDGSGQQTEIDLFLVGAANLITVECKQEALFGRCSRYASGRCPEVHAVEGERAGPCRYWEEPAARFEWHLRFGPRPLEDDGSLACDRHYQLARTLLVGMALAERLGLKHHFWVFAPRRHWPALQPLWLDFTDRVRDEGVWRRMRVLAWEDIEALPTR